MRLIVVADPAETGGELRRFLEARPAFPATVEYADASQALGLALGGKERSPAPGAADVVVLLLRLGFPAEDLIARFAENEIPVIVISETDSAGAAVAALKAGALDFLVWRDLTAESLRTALQEAAGQKKARRPAEADARDRSGGGLPVSNESDANEPAERLRDSEAHLTAILQNTDALIYVMDEDSRFVHINRRFGELFGLRPPEVRGKSVYEVFPEDFAEIFAANNRRVLETGQAVEFEETAPLADGVHTYISLKFPHTDAAGAPRGVIGVSTDITERKRVEEALRASEEDFRAMFEIASVGKAQADAATRRFLRVNAAFCDLTGYTEAELLGMTVDELTHPDDRQRDAELYRRLVSGRAGAYDSEKRYVRKDGGVVWVQATGTVTRDDRERSLRTLAVIQEVTGRKRREANLAFLAELGENFARLSPAQEILETVAEKIGAFLNVSSCLFAAVDEEEDSVRAQFAWSRTPAEEARAGPPSPGVYRLSEFVTEEFRQAARRGETIVVRDTRRDARTEAAAHAAHGIRSFISVPFRRDGEWKYLFTVNDEAPRDWRADEIELVNELTTRVFPRLERARAEEALRKSEAEFRLLAEALPQIVWVTDGRGKVTFVNRRWTEFSGLDVGETADPENVARVIHPEDRERVFGEWRKAYRTGSDYDIEARMRDHRTGEYCWFLMRSVPVRDEAAGGDAILQWFGTSTDITEQKRAEGVLERYRLLSEKARDVIWLVRPDGQIVEVNQAAVESYGYTREELLSMNVADLRDESKMTDFAGQLGDAFAGTHFETIHVRKDGTRFPVEVSATGADFGGERLILSIVRDTTERRQIEEALRESEKRFRNMADHAPVMVWVTGADGACTYLSQSWYEFTGQTPETGLGFGWFEATHPDDRETAERSFRLANERRAPFQLEYRLRDRNGEYHWSIDSAQPRFSENGEFLGYIGSVIDIGERKRAEDALRTSEEQLRTLVDSIPQLAWMAEPDGFIFWYNRRWFEYTGATAGEVRGWGWQSLHDPQVLPAVLEKWNHSLRTGERFEMEYPLRGADGVFRWFLTRINPLRDSGGRITRWFGTNTDIDESRRMREALSRSEKELQQMADAMPQVVWIADRAGTVNYYNRRVSEFFGVRRSADGTWDWQPTLYPEDLEATLGAWQKAVREKTPYAIEHRILMRDGGYRWHLSRGFPVLGENGEIAKWYGTATDIHEIKEAEAERERLLENEHRARELAEEANRSKDEFLAILSHELRSPLNAMYGWTQILQNHDYNEEMTRKAVEVIARNVRLQNALIEDLLDVSRIISGKMRLESENTSLVGIVQSALDAARPAAEKQGISIESALDPEADEVFGDKLRLQQVVSNLLTNALKFTPENGVVTVTLIREGAAARLAVKDTGIGIAPEILPHIFDRFKQAESTSKRKFGGLGLGLTIVKHLVELHGGRVSAHSEGEHRGATFLVEIPLLPQVISHADLRPSDASSPGFAENGNTKPAAAAPPPLQNVRILLVDDDADALDLMCTVLRTQGAEVFGATGAGEALVALVAAPFDLLISDLGMPETDGYDLIKRVREKLSVSTLPAIALTGYVSADDRARVLEAGFQMHLPKPVELEKLPALVLGLVKNAKDAPEG